MDAHSEKYLCVGLGNPGLRYEHTRHNIGCRIIDQWRKSLGLQFSERHFKARSVKTTLHYKTTFLLCPLTFMNLSGYSVDACAEYYDLSISNILVVHDDLDLPTGRIKAARNGGAGGHKGVRSIIEHLQDSHFPRIKIGIGRPRHGETVEDFVLSSFYADEKPIIESVVSSAVDACEMFVSEGIERVMNSFNAENPTYKEVEP